MSTPNPYRFGSEVVRACAGAGKTTRLSKRIIKLLVNDVPPEEIIALTFTRAAASEFVARLLKMLASGARSAAGAAKLAQELELPERRANGEAWDQAFFQGKLKQTLQSINRMTLGTLDSFFARVVSNNPTELGLDIGQVKTAGELDGPRIRKQITKQALQEVFRRDENAIKQRLSELKLGAESATPLANFEQLVESLHETMLLANDPLIWGVRSTIWPKGSELFDQPDKQQWTTAKDHLLQWIAEVPCEKGYARERTQKHFENLVKAVQSKALDATSIGYINDQFKAVLAAGPNATATFTHKHGATSTCTLTLDAAGCAAYRTLVRGALAAYIEGKCTQSQAAYALLKTYDAFYRDELRKSGQLSFSDYVNLLLSLPAERKLDLEYRLDCRFRHWLFDEFQDTSSRQWKVLSGHLSETTKNPQDWSTTYFVGDPKQSLYSWRGGNPKLLGKREEETRERFGEGAIVPLKKTYRCAGPIVDMVNDLLGRHDLLDGIVPADALDNWRQNFASHESAVEKERQKGEAMWVRLPKPLTGTPLAAQAQWIVEHLKASGLTEGRYLKPGFTCAILVSSNDDAAAISEIIRFQGLEAADEAETPVAMDNPFTAGFVGILRNCVHPDDALSKGLAEMAPAAKAYLDANGGWEATRSKIAKLFYAQGAAAALRELTSQVDLSEAKPGEENAWNFLRMRLRQLLTLGSKYDALGERDLRGAADYIAETSLRDNADRAAIQVLTIHRSKGLQYTAVYLPQLNDSYHYIGRERQFSPLMLDDPETFEPKWILHRPSKDIRQFDGEFRKAQRAEQSDEAYEALCKLYVGMTRAERRLVLISDEIDDKNSPSDAATYDYAKLIEKVFGAKPAATAGGSPIMKLYGDPSWIGLIEPQAKRGSDDPIEGWAQQEFAPVVPLQRFLPSDNKPKKRYPFRSRTKVDLSKAKGKDIGNTIHALMEPLQWDIAAFLKGLRGDSSSRATDPLHQQAVEIIESCLQSTAVAAALTDQPKGAELLKERKFTLIMEEGKVLSGNADRIHLVAGKSATIFDYKSDTCDLDELKAKHSDQMEMYRLATSRIWGIPIAQIKCYLIHVRQGQLVEV